MDVRNNKPVSYIGNNRAPKLKNLNDLVFGKVVGKRSPTDADMPFGDFARKYRQNINPSYFRPVEPALEEKVEQLIQQILFDSVK